MLTSRFRDYFYIWFFHGTLGFIGVISEHTGNLAQHRQFELLPSCGDASSDPELGCIMLSFVTADV